MVKQYILLKNSSKDSIFYEMAKRVINYFSMLRNEKEEESGR